MHILEFFTYILKPPILNRGYIREFGQQMTSIISSFKFCLSCLEAPHPRSPPLGGSPCPATEQGKGMKMPPYWSDKDNFDGDVLPRGPHKFGQDSPGLRHPFTASSVPCPFFLSQLLISKKSCTPNVILASGKPNMWLYLRACLPQALGPSSYR